MPDYFVHPSSYIDPKRLDRQRHQNLVLLPHPERRGYRGKLLLRAECQRRRNVKIGNGVKVQNNVSIYEGVELQDYVFCGPSMVFTNDLTPRAKYPKGSAGYKRTLVKEGALDRGQRHRRLRPHHRPLGADRLGRGGDPRRPRPRADARRARPSGRLGLRVRPDSGQDPPLPRLRPGSYREEDTGLVEER